MKNNILINTTLVLLTTTILFGVGLSSNSTSATSASTALASVKVAASCTLTTTGGGNYSATVPNGTSAEIAGSTMSVSCNDAGGFALYAVGYSDDTVGNNNMIGSSVNIATNTSGNDSYWAMKINPTSGTTPTIENSFNNYHIVPDIHTKVASYASSTGTGSLSVNATYKANISSTQLAGNYLGKVKYTLVHPANEVPPHEVACQANRICYNANTNIVEGQMGKQIAYSNDEAILYAPNFKRDGYGFAGWSDKYDYETNSDAHFYGPQETITVPNNISTNGLSLYAVWIKSQGSMQSDNAINICESLTKAPTDGTANLSSVSALTDDRDGNTYAIAKLADNECWMIENLRLDDSATLTAANTRNPSLPLLNTNNGSSNHLSSTTNPAQTSWCTTDSIDCNNQSMLSTDNTTFFINNTSSTQSSNIYNYGNYYNWYSATAGHGKYGNDYGSGYNAPGDICPAGWHLPKGGDKSQESINEFWSLIVTSINDGTKPENYNSTTQPYYLGSAEASPIDKALRSYPNNFVNSGSIYGSSIGGRNSYGGYWTSSGYDYKNAHPAGTNINRVDPGTSNSNKYYGFAIRCITAPAF